MRCGGLGRGQQDQEPRLIERLPNFAGVKEASFNSEKFLEMTFSNGKLVQTVSQFGEGIPSAVEARLAGRALAANKK